MEQEINFLKAADQEYHFTADNLPALIHYKPKEGGSHYSMTLIEHLALQGSKVLILTGYVAAKQQFANETPKLAEDTVIVETLDEVIINKDKQVIIIHNDDEDLCLKAIKTLDDINDRIIFIKNIDIVHQLLITECLKHNRLILSGDLDNCTSKKLIIKNHFASFILFSQPEITIPYHFVSLKPYIGYIRSNTKEGYVGSIV